VAGFCRLSPGPPMRAFGSISRLSVPAACRKAWRYGACHSTNWQRATVRARVGAPPHVATGLTGGACCVTKSHVGVNSATQLQPFPDFTRFAARCGSKDRGREAGVAARRARASQRIDSDPAELLKLWAVKEQARMARKPVISRCGTGCSGRPAPARGTKGPKLTPRALLSSRAPTVQPSRASPSAPPARSS